MRLKELQIKEAATAGATASGNIAAVVNPHVANPSRKSVAYTGKPGGPSGEGPVAQYVAKKQKPTDNALDGDKLLMSSKTPQMIRRQIEEGSLYEGWPIVAGLAALAGAGWAGYKKLKGAADDTVKKVADRRSKTDQRIAQALGTPTPKKKTEEGLRIEPRGEAGKANAFKQAMADVSKNKETRAINTEKSKRQTAQAAGYRAIVGGKDLSQIAKG